MKLLIFGLAGAEANLLFQDERLDGIRYLMEIGCYGILKTDLVENTAQVWISLATSQAPTWDTQVGDILTSNSTPIWEFVASSGKRAIVIDTPPGLSYPDWIQEKISDIDHKSPLDPGAEVSVRQIINRIEVLSQNKFAFLREFMQTEEWDYLQYVDSGINQLWNLVDSEQVIEKETALLDYYLYLNEQLKSLFELLGNETVVLLISPYGVTGKDGFFIMAGGNNPLEGEIKGINLLDIAPTLLELGGYDIPATMQGKSLVLGMLSDSSSPDGLTADEDEILRERLSGLGYLE